MTPKLGFRSFLERAEDDGWISSYRWITSDSWPSLREKLGGPAGPGISRTHKKGNDGVWYAIEVEAHDGTSVGVDLEILMSRPILDNPAWILRRLNMTKAGSPKAVIEEWSAREAGFKALAPDNTHLTLGQFRRTAPNTLGVFTSTGDRLVQVRSNWQGTWCLSLAWRSLS